MKLILSIITVFTCSIGFGQIPNGYYDSAIGFTGVPLKAQLNLIIKDHVQASCYGGYTRRYRQWICGKKQNPQIK